MKAIWKYFFVVFFIIHYGLNRLVIFDERLLIIATVMSVLSNNWIKERIKVMNNKFSNK